MLLALLPLVAATVAFSEVAERGETGSTDQASTAIRVAVADYEEQLDEDAVRTARSLAHATQVQLALDARNRSSLVRTAKEVEHSAFFSPENDFLAGERPGPFDGYRESQSRLRRKVGGQALSSTFRSTTLSPGVSRHRLLLTRAIASRSSALGASSRRARSPENSPFPTRNRASSPSTGASTERLELRYSRKTTTAGRRSRWSRSVRKRQSTRPSATSGIASSSSRPSPWWRSASWPTPSGAPSCAG